MLKPLPRLLGGRVLPLLGLLDRVAPLSSAATEPSLIMAKMGPESAGCAPRDQGPVAEHLTPTYPCFVGAFVVLEN